MHRLLELGFIVVMALLLPYLVSLRSGGNGKLSRRNWILLMIVGVVVAGIFISSQSLYEVQTTI
jgi:hypothetical protein